MIAWPALPDGFAVGEAVIGPGDDRHVQGRLAARRALERVADTSQVTIEYDGTRPILLGAERSISITHGRTRALAIVAPAARLGIDLCDDPGRVARLAPRYLSAEHALATSPERCAQVFCVKEAALKALGLGLLDGGVFDDAWPFRVVSLDPPVLEPPDLHVRCGSVAEGPFAIVFG